MGLPESIATWKLPRDVFRKSLSHLSKILAKLFFYYYYIAIFAIFLYWYIYILTSELHIDFRTQCVIMMQTRWYPTPSHLRRSQNFEKIDSLLKPALNIFILRNSIAGWWASELWKKRLFSGTKSLDLGKVFIKVIVGINLYGFKYLRWKILWKLFSTISC